MAIFLDTGRLEEIEKFHRMGIIRGVTTNPTIMLRDGLTGGMDELRRQICAMAAMIAPLPLSVEVLTNDRDGMIAQALEFTSWAENIVIKVTIHGPNGELDNVEVIHELEHTHNIRVNVTAMMSAQQCFLAAMAGATYVSIFAGRINNMGCNSVDEISKLRLLLDRFNLSGQIIAASTREVLNVVEWLSAGAHIVTVTPSLLHGMLVHPYSKETVQQFLRDAEQVTSLAAVGV